MSDVYEAVRSILGETGPIKVQQVEHSAECKAAYADWERRFAEFEAKYPNYCQFCGGHGGHISYYDPSPAGMSLGSGWMLDYEPCPECIEKGICPRCGAKFDGDPECDDFDVCDECGFSAETPDDAPEEPECLCGVIDVLLDFDTGIDHYADMP